MSALGHNYTFSFEDYLFPLNRKFFALIKNIYDCFGGQADYWLWLIQGKIRADLWQKCQFALTRFGGESVLDLIL
tara:strand:- start:217 stop:441 length:225 start_codon:yes stop_codon:yes gene_type:complete